jgi:hypothetical protein
MTMKTTTANANCEQVVTVQNGWLQLPINILACIMPSDPRHVSGTTRSYPASQGTIHGYNEPRDAYATKPCLAAGCLQGENQSHP